MEIEVSLQESAIRGQY